MRSFGKEAGRQEIIWKGGKATGDHLERGQGDRRNAVRQEMEKNEKGR
jgi:hypothetical protein